MPQVKVNKTRCLRCGHEWVSRTTDVRRCPKCQSPYWDRPRVRPKTEKRLPALAYVKGHVQRTDMGKLSARQPFEGSRQIGHDLYQRIATLGELTLICNQLKMKPTFVPVATIEYEDATRVDSLIQVTRR